MYQKIIKIGFIGAGSIGSLFGASLATIQSKKFSIEMVFFCREEHAKKINKDGLKIHLKSSVRIINNIKAYNSRDDYKVEDDGFDFLFLTTKAYDIEKAITQYKDLIDNCKWLVILQNGIGNEEIIMNYCEQTKLIRILTSHGALLKSAGNIQHTGKGFTYIGFPFIDSEKLSEEDFRYAQSSINLLKTLLNLAGIETSIVENIIGKSWEKTFVNIGINALGALTRLKNGKLLEIESLKRIMTDAVKEAFKVAKLKRIELSKTDFVELTYSVAKKTYHNKNSMLQDVLLCKKTEIDFMNGKIIEYAKEVGIYVPVNDLLTALVKGLEKSQKQGN